MKETHQKNIDQLFSETHSQPQGLSASQAETIRKSCGWNELPEGAREPAWKIFLKQFQDFLVLVLIASAIVSGVLGDWESTLIILAVITVNAILGTVQTLKAEQSLQGLKKLSGPSATVLRDQKPAKLPTREIVVGDVVLLEAGDSIPADGRLLSVQSLRTDESSLTGESVPVEKQTGSIAPDAPLGERSNMVFSGSLVTYGRGSFLVTETGLQTEMGKIARLLKNTQQKKTPLQISLDRFGRTLSILIMLFCALLFGVSVFRGEPIGSAFMFAVALAVAAIPEALNSIVTIVLSFGTQKMAAENAVVRKLQAVEGLGSVSVICSDKTGTLTQNKMTVEHYYTEGQAIPANQIDLSVPAQQRLLQDSLLCCDASIENGAEIGDPTEVALVRLAHTLNTNTDQVRSHAPRLSELPFDSDRKLMSVLCQENGNGRMVVKGAVDVMLNRIDSIQTAQGCRPIRETDRTEILTQNTRFTSQGQRVLAFAYKEISPDHALQLDDESGLTFLGLISMIDPPREDAKEAVAQCRRAHIKPVMITGDHKGTAAAIAQRVGILDSPDQACDGAELDRMSDQELEQFVDKISVYARVTPEHKIRIVRAWQKRGAIVAMTGDGVNDAPALKQADIGVAMGMTGTEVAKDAAAMVLTNDRFSTIVKAVQNGRNIYRNITHSIEFLLSGNFGAILSVLCASLLNLPLPFAPVHLLFINLLTDSLPAIALGLEPHTNDVMQQKPRPSTENILTRSFLGWVGLEGLVIGTLTMTGFFIGLSMGGPALASTFAFGTLCLSRLVHGFNCKSEKCVLFSKRIFNNPWLLGASALGFVLLTAVLMIPALQGMFQVTSLKIGQFGIICLLAALEFPIVQFAKWIKNKI